MARVCEICGKGVTVGNQRKLLRGHYNVTAKRRFVPNLQKTTIAGKKVKACVKCMRTETRKTATLRQAQDRKATATKTRAK